MKSFNITEKYFEIDGKPTPFLCGEIHYFRMDCAVWEKALDKLVEAGANAVAYYVPWFVHEYEEGAFDFDGSRHPSNNLHRFIKLTQERNLVAILRPGPYVYAEATDLGIPKWFTEKYPSSHPLVYKNGAYESYGFKHYAAHNNKDFLACTKRWLEKVMQEVRRYLAPNGNIYMLQLCNEIPGDDNMDENPENLGIGNKEGIFPRYLKEQYGSVQALNGLYGTSFEVLEQICPHELCAANKALYKTEKLRYYYAFYFPEYFCRLREMLGQLPENIVLIHNAYNPKAISLHCQNKKKNPWLNIGIDCYYSLFGSLSLKNGSYFCDYGAEYSRAMLKNPPWVIEQECGYWNDFPTVYGPELYIWNIWTMAAGYKGFNMYLFAAGVNRTGMGFFGTDHNWQAPVDKNGNEFYTFKDIQRSLADISDNFNDLCADNKYDIALGITQSYGLIWRNAANHSRECYFALRQAGYSPKIVDFESADLNELTEHKAMCIAAHRYMNNDVQEKLVNYIKGGNKLFLLGCVPYLNENEQLCTVLADYLNLNVGNCVDAAEEQTKILYNNTQVFAGRTLQPIADKSQSLPKNITQAEIYKADIKEGTVIVLPCAVNVVFHSMPELIKQILAAENIMPSLNGTFLIRAIPKINGKTVLINPSPVTATEKISINGEAKEYTVNAFSFKIVQ